nr:hypothetical protein [Tanacetum cinerariifolium]
TDLVKITKKWPKPDKIEHEIEKIAQKPDPKTVLCTDLVKITKKWPKPDKIEHEIEKIAQKPDPKTVLCTKAQITNQDKEKCKYKDLFYQLLKLQKL